MNLVIFREVRLNERYETVLDEQPITSDEYLGTLYMILVYSAMTEYTKYTCTLKEEKTLKDTFIYQVSITICKYYD